MVETEDIDEVEDRIEKNVDRVVEYEKEIKENKEDLRDIFKKTLHIEGTNYEVGSLFQGIDLVLKRQVEETDDLDGLKQSIIGIVMNYRSGFDEEFRSRGLDDFADFFFNLHLDFGRALTREYSRANEGRNYFSSLKSNVGYRSGLPYLEHELLIDYEKEVRFSGDIQSNLFLIDHVVQQLVDLPDNLGQSTLEKMDVEMLEDILEDLTELKERAEDYQNDDELETARSEEKDN